MRQCIAGVALNNRTHALEGFGEAKPPRDLYFLVRFAGKAGKAYQKRMILGGPQALQTSRLAGDRVSPYLETSLDLQRGMALALSSAERASQAVRCNPSSI